METQERVLTALTSDMQQWLINEKELLAKKGEESGKNPLEFLQDFIRDLCIEEIEESHPPTLQHLVWRVHRRVNLRLEILNGRLTAGVPRRKKSAA